MSPEDKISPAFEPFLADSHRRDRHEALVIYRAPGAEETKPEKRRVDETRRRRVAAEQAAAHRVVETRIFAEYQEASEDRLAISSIGSSALPVATVEVTRQTLEALARQTDVVAILPNQTIHLIEPQSVSYEELAGWEVRWGATWGLEQMDIRSVWETTKGAGITVGVLDTGVYGSHPIFNKRISDFVVIDPLGRRIETATAFDAGTHGTHVCGTIIGGETAEGVAIGVAPEAEVCMAGVLLGEATIRTLLEGLDWAVEKGASIVNLSLGFNYYEPLFTEVFGYLIEQYGVLPVVAVGNENQGNSSSPGNAYNALAVGAVEKMPRNRVDVTFFSSGASLVFPGSAQNEVVTKPDVVAPGVQVLSSIPPTLRSDGAYLYSYMDGTSMATPHVAGVAALLMAAYPEASVVDIAQALKETAHHPDGDRRPDNRWGYGMIRPQEALQALA